MGRNSTNSTDYYMYKYCNYDVAYSADIYYIQRKYLPSQK